MISEKIFLNHNINDVWNTLSSKNALELFHPFCLQNDVIEYENCLLYTSPSPRD